MKDKTKILVLAYVIITTIAFVTITYLKLDAYKSWRYTSDIFCFDTAMQETLQGHFGKEFTFGNTFGDHSYFIFLILLPFKLILANKFIYLLLVLGPIIFYLSNLYLTFTLMKLTSIPFGIGLGLVNLFLFGLSSQAIFESTYGMHPDFISGYLAIMVGAFLWRSEHLKEPIAKYSWMILLLAVILFYSLKEEMILLAGMFLLVIAILFRSRKSFALTLITFTLFGGSIAFVNHNQTPFNRSNETLIEILMNTISKSGWTDIFFSPSIDFYKRREFIVFVGVAIMLTLFLFLMSQFKSKIAYSLILVGFLKLLISLSIFDWDIKSWHNFPAVVMIIGALILQAGHLRNSYPKISNLLIVVSLLITGFIVVKSDIPFIRGTLTDNRENRQEIAQFGNELADLINDLDPERVTAIPVFAAKQWVGKRYSFYPRGVTFSPQGISDYIVFPINRAAQFGQEGISMLPVESIPSQFKLLTRSENFIIFKRISLSEKDHIDRSYFDMLPSFSGISKICP